MIRNLILCATILTATFAGYSAGRPTSGVSTANVGPVRVPAATIWIPPSFDIATAPPEALLPHDASASVSAEE